MSLLDYEFGLEYDIMLSAWGEGILSESSLLDFQQPDVILNKYKIEYRKDPKSISLFVQDPMAAGYDYGYTGVDTAFLEKLEALKELILPPSVSEIQMTPKLMNALVNNKTLIRGTFDSFAERFARENDLHFRHSDFVFAEYELERPPESTKLTMQFKRNGKVVIREDISSPGTSASNTLGGTFYHSLKSDFYKKTTAEEISELFSAGLRDAVLGDGRLEAFLSKAKTRDLFAGNNR